MSDQDNFEIDGIKYHAVECTLADVDRCAKCTFSCNNQCNFSLCIQAPPCSKRTRKDGRAVYFWPDDEAQINKQDSGADKDKAAKAEEHKDSGNSIVDEISEMLLGSGSPEDLGAEETMKWGDKPRFAGRIIPSKPCKDWTWMLGSGFCHNSGDVSCEHLRCAHCIYDGSPKNRARRAAFYKKTFGNESNTNKVVESSNPPEDLLKQGAVVAVGSDSDVKYGFITRIFDGDVVIYFDVVDEERRLDGYDYLEDVIERIQTVYNNTVVGHSTFTGDPSDENLDVSWKRKKAKKTERSSDTQEKSKKEQIIERIHKGVDEKLKDLEVPESTKHAAVSVEISVELD